MLALGGVALVLDVAAVEICVIFCLKDYDIFFIFRVDVANMFAILSLIGGYASYY